MQGSGLRVEGAGFRVSGRGCRVSDFGFRVSGFGFRVSGFGFRISNFGFWDSDRVAIVREARLRFHQPFHLPRVGTDKCPHDLTPNAVEPIPTLGAFFPRGGPINDPVLTGSRG